MKRFLILLIPALLILACSDSADGEKSSGHFKIKGTIEGLDDGVVQLLKVVDNDKVPIDTAFVVGGHFMFTGKVELPVRHYIKVEDKPKTIDFFVENSKIKIAAHIDSLREAEITGSAAQDEYDAFEESLTSFRDQMKGISDRYRAADSLGNKDEVKEIEKEAESLEEKRTDHIKSYIFEHKDSPVSVYILLRHLAYQMNFEELSESVGMFPEAFDEHPYIQNLNERLSTLEKVAIGKEAPDFFLHDPEGNPVSLSSLKGKYVLIDFWASWCGPCRKENPNVVAMYNEMKDKDFEIFGVSLDTKQENWMKAIEDDQLAWAHVSDLKGWGSAAGKLYGVSAIPHTVLLDKNGVIIDKNLRGDNLRERMQELLN